MEQRELRQKHEPLGVELWTLFTRPVGVIDLHALHGRPVAAVADRE